MDNNNPPSPVPISAHLSNIAIVGDLGQTQSKYSVTVLVDDDEVVKSEKKSGMPSPQWEWPEDEQFLIHPLSTIVIKLHEKSRVRMTKKLLGQYTGKITELLGTNVTLELEDQAGTIITPKVKVTLSLVSEAENGFESIMNTTSANVSRLDSTKQMLPGLAALGTAIDLSKNLVDLVSGTPAHPILKVACAVMSAVYGAVKQVGILDDAVRDLVESLRETLGVAKGSQNLLVIDDTTNVVEEIGRLSLKVASLIHEYTQAGFIRRAIRSQLSEDIPSRIAKCQALCNDLKEKFDRRVILDTNRQVKTIKDDQLAHRIYQWLAAPDCSKNYNEACEKQQVGTCEWFLNGERFSEFKKKGDFLWIKGKAGCGKTILSSSIIKEIIKICKENLSSANGYFFFDGRDSQKDLQLHDKLLRSLIDQLSRQCNGIPAPLVELYGDGHQQPSTDGLRGTLNKIINGFNSVYIVIDSLDECTQREKTLPWIKEMIPHTKDNLHMVVASRPERDIVDFFRPLERDYMDLGEEVTQDIAMYLDEQLSVVGNWDEETREDVKTSLITGAQGMFRWIALQLSELKKCSSPRAVRVQLKSLPKGLFESYDRLLLTINEQSDRTDTKTFLTFLCFAARPMNLEEIAEAVTVVFENGEEPRHDPKCRYWDPRDVLNKCSGFVVESEGKIKLAHFSVKEYLLSSHLRMKDHISSFHLESEILAHSIISQTCLTYLLQYDVPHSLNWDVLHASPLAKYAAECWITHALSGGINEPNTSPIFVLARALFTSNNRFINWVRLFDVQDQGTELELDRIHIPMPLSYAAFAGIGKLVQYLVDVQNADVNAFSGRYGNALQAASVNGHVDIVQILLGKGADMNVFGGHYGYALHAASDNGHLDIVQILLANGADVNASGGYYGNALYAASVRGYLGIVQVLLTKGAEVNASGGYYGNALHAASHNGHLDIVQVLLTKGADVNVSNGYYSNALQTASHKGHLDIVQVLLANGADVNADGEEYGNALQAASANGHLDIVQILLAKEADVNVSSGYNALYAASANGHRDIVQILLAKGADVNASSGYNALYAASDNEHLDIVHILLDNGADANASDGRYGNALQAASVNGHLDIVQSLLTKGADVNASGGQYGNALQAASHYGHLDIVQILLVKGADVNVSGGHYGNALQAASHNGHLDIVQVLLAKGADVNASSSLYGDALQAASVNGHLDIVQVLLTKGADVNASGGQYGNALQAASCYGHLVIVQILLVKGADVNVSGGHYGNALQAASHNGHLDIVQILLTNGADVNASSEEYGNALQAASAQGHLDIVQVLLAKGADVNAFSGYYSNALQTEAYRSALHAAITRGHEAIVRLLIDKGADLNAQGGQFGNALQDASYEGQHAIVKLLIERGADVNAEGGKYGHALMAALHNGHIEIAILLRDNGADPTAHFNAKFKWLQ